MTIATGATRLADTFIRAGKERADQVARDRQVDLEDAQTRYEAQARVADQLYARASDPAWMNGVDRAEAIGVWEAAQIWADLDQERFQESADNITTAYRQAYGADPRADAERTRDQRSSTQVQYDSPTTRSQRTTALVNAGWPTEAVHARAVSDNLNAADPVTTRSRRSDGASARAQQARNGRRTTERTQGYER